MLSARDGWPDRRADHRGSAAVSTFGPKKIKARLEDESCRKGDGTTWPAASTIGDILKRANLVEPQRKRRRAIAQGEVVAPARTPNEEWAIDFKGWFRTADGRRCDPLTITDQASRFLVEVRIVEPTWAGVRCALERVFEHVGLPEAIRSDNGSPFGSTGAGGLSALSVWWLKLGIEPRYIPPSSPQDNGRHERMHRTLKAETSMPAARTAGRAAEALRPLPPALQRGAAARGARADGAGAAVAATGACLPPRLEDPWYDADHEVRRVRPAGDIKWRGERHVYRRGIRGRAVGLAEHDSGGHIVRFCQPRSRGDRPRPPLPALCSAACAAARRCGSGGDNGTMSEYCQPSARSKMSGINPVEQKPGRCARFTPPLTPPRQGEGNLSSALHGWRSTASEY